MMMKAKRYMTLTVDFSETPFMEIPDAVRDILDRCREQASVEKATLTTGAIDEDVTLE